MTIRNSSKEQPQARHRNNVYKAGPHKRLVALAFVGGAVRVWKRWAKSKSISPVAVLKPINVSVKRPLVVGS